EDMDGFQADTEEEEEEEGDCMIMDVPDAAAMHSLFQSLSDSPSCHLL
ncbi:CHAF1A isoform 7, partial [Pongo abelii]